MINKNHPVDDPVAAFKEVIAILEKNGRYLGAIGLKPSTRMAYRRTVAYLKRLHVDEILSIIGARKGTGGTQKRFADPTMSDDDLRNLSAEQIRDFIASGDISRYFLERMAKFRFGMTAGALSVYGSRAALVDKLNTLLGHEGTHEAITRIIESDGTRQRESSSSRQE